MKIDKEKCIGCEACHPYCPVESIATIESQGKPVSEIIPDNCVECGACLRSEVCPTDAIQTEELTWPRSIRAAFSNPFAIHPLTKIRGRGTEEMKTNDVTGRFRHGFAGVAIEMGRPILGTTFRDLETVTMAIAKLEVEFEPQNPVTPLIVDKKTGKINEEVLEEKALTAIVEFVVESNRLKEVLETIKNVSNRIETVFSMSLISRVNKDGSIQNISIAKEAGFLPKLSVKTNVGLGRPLKEEA
jgi:NAD-dependent dihydropyrimidine dehydrogenase PreA subunit